MEKITAYKSSNGKLFVCEEDAILEDIRSEFVDFTKSSMEDREYNCLNDNVAHSQVFKWVVHNADWLNMFTSKILSIHPLWKHLWEKKK